MSGMTSMSDKSVWAVYRRGVRPEFELYENKDDAHRAYRFRGGHFAGVCIERLPLVTSVEVTK